MLWARKRPGCRERVAAAALVLIQGASMLAVAAPDAQYEFLDAFRPGSEESVRREYAPVPWSASQRALVSARLESLHQRAPGLLDRAADGGRIGLYRAQLPGISQAKGAYRRLTFDAKAFPSPGYDWLTRIIAHELVHTADPYNRLSSDPEWTTLAEPRITTARDVLAKKGYTTAQAASLPLGPKRDEVETAVQAASGLPSAYAAHDSEEMLAEVVSFMLVSDTGYAPPVDMATFLRKHLLDPAPKIGDPAGAAYREGLRRAAAGKYNDAQTSFSEALRADPNFMLAYMERAHARQEMQLNPDALADFTQAIAHAPRYSRMHPYLLASRGLLRLDSGDVSGALADCASALPLRADHYGARFLCGRAKLASSDFSGAVLDFEAAVKALPSYSDQVEPWLKKARSGLDSTR